MCGVYAYTQPTQTKCHKPTMNKCGVRIRVWVWERVNEMKQTSDSNEIRETKEIRENREKKEDRA